MNWYTEELHSVFSKNLDLKRKQANVHARLGVAVTLDSSPPPHPCP